MGGSRNASQGNEGVMNVAVDKIMQARNYDGVASKLTNNSKKTAQKQAAKEPNEALKAMFPFIADYCK